jgi:hypothetical protein
LNIKVNQNINIMLPCPKALLKGGGGIGASKDQFQLKPKFSVRRKTMDCNKQNSRSTEILVSTSSHSKKNQGQGAINCL